MEEDWNDISPPPPLYSSQNLNRNPVTHHGLILQDFLNPDPTGKATGSDLTRRLLCVTTVSYFPSSLSYSPSFDQAMAPTSVLVKQSLEENDCPVVGDRRHNRKMKNRESAARSRSRRMAYTYALERKRSLLIDDNARLRKEIQDQQLLSAAVAVAIDEEAPKRRSLTRSLSALF